METKTKEIITVRRIGTNGWVKELNSINKDKIAGGFKKADGSYSKTSIGVGIDKDTGFRKRVLDDKEQKELEKALKYPAGHLDIESDFWKEFSVDIQGPVLVLDTTNPMDILKLKVLQSKTNLVANGLEELKKKANAEFVIVSEVEEAKKSNKLRSVKKEAYMAFGKMSHSEMVDVLIALGKKPTDMSPEMIENAMGIEVEQNPNKVLSIWNNPKFKQIVFMQKLINFGIVKRAGDSIHYEDTLLGFDMSSAIDFINNIENKNILLTLQDAYENRAVMMSKLRK